MPSALELRSWNTPGRRTQQAIIEPALEQTEQRGGLGSVLRQSIAQSIEARADLQRLEREGFERLDRGVQAS